ncbi:lysozyme [Novosphingobium capsulatum]|uniref:lysozyme n=1 Tax=Novosphingobium capsulatum TaxID=13688 RepID=UPI001C3FC496|nr:lysozyme [Novosphingobium capsulatum]WQD92778.1 lysozyme [Novosphingobium capsulatum]
MGVPAAIILLISVPKEESGRTVQVSMAADGTSNVQHVSGQQYLAAYRDIAGIATACDGLTAGVRIGQTFTPAQCASMLESELVRHAQGVMACTPGLALDKPRRDNIRAAAVSMAYNIGVSAWCGSTARKRIDAGDIRGACDSMLAWDKARVNGVLRPVAGLTARRQRERTLCLKDA